MYEGVPMSPHVSGSEPPIRWLGSEPRVAAPVQHETAPEVVAQADPEAVIEFLLKKVDEQQAALEAQMATIAEQQGNLSAQATTLAEHQTALVGQNAEVANHVRTSSLMAEEIDQLRGQLQVTREELDRQLGDYEVMMQNTLATERELEARKREVDELRLELDRFKQSASTKPKISLPFHTEQKLAKLGWGEPTAEAAEEREAV